MQTQSAPIEIRRVSYAWNSALEQAGSPAYFLDAYVSRDGETLVDQSGSYRTRAEFMQAIENVVPLLEAEVTDDDTSGTE